MSVAVKKLNNSSSIKVCVPNTMLNFCENVKTTFVNLKMWKTCRSSSCFFRSFCFTLLCASDLKIECGVPPWISNGSDNPANSIEKEEDNGKLTSKLDSEFQRLNLKNGKTLICSNSTLFVWNIWNWKVTRATPKIQCAIVRQRRAPNNCNCGPFTWKHSWRGRILGEHWRQRRRRRRTRRRWPWCRRLEGGSSVCWPGWWTWPARWSPPGPPSQALPCGPTRRTSRTLRQSSCKAHTPSPRRRRAGERREVPLWGRSRRRWQWWRRSTCCHRHQAWTHRGETSCRRAGRGYRFSTRRPGRSSSNRLQMWNIFPRKISAIVVALESRLIGRKCDHFSFFTLGRRGRRSYLIQYLIDPSTLVLSSHCCTQKRRKLTDQGDIVKVNLNSFLFYSTALQPPCPQRLLFPLTLTTEIFPFVSSQFTCGFCATLTLSLPKSHALTDWLIRTLTAMLPNFLVPFLLAFICAVPLELTHLTHSYWMGYLTRRLKTLVVVLSPGGFKKGVKSVHFVVINTFWFSLRAIYILSYHFWKSWYCPQLAPPIRDWVIWLLSLAKVTKPNHPKCDKSWHQRMV